MARKTDLKVWVYPSPKSLKILGSTSPALNDALENWAYQISKAMVANEKLFEAAEWKFLADWSNSTVFTPGMDTGASLAHATRDAAALDGLDQKWGVDANALSAKLDALDYAGAWAVINCLRFYWDNVDALTLDQEWWTLAFRNSFQEE